MSWASVSIGDCVEKIASWNPSRSAGDTPFLYIDLSSVDKDKKEVDRSSVSSLLPSEAPSRARQLVKSGDVLVATVRPNLNGVALVPEEYEGATASTGYCVLRPDHNLLDGKYLYYWVQTGAFVTDMMEKATGANYPAVSDKVIKESKIPLPLLEEQKRIATILDKADAIRRKRQQAIQLADEFLCAVFLDMFGDPGRNKANWPTIKIGQAIELGYILEVQDGNHGNDHPKVADFVDEGYPFVAANVVRNGKVLFDKCYYLDESWIRKLRIGFAKPKDVLISHKGSLGFTAVLDDTFDTYIFSPQTTYYRVDRSRLDPIYLKGYFDSDYFQNLFKKEGVQSTRAYIGITRQKELPILIPPVESQQRFVEVASRYAHHIERLGLERDAISELFFSLSKKAFSGGL